MRTLIKPDIKGIVHKNETSLNHKIPEEIIPKNKLGNWKSSMQKIKEQSQIFSPYELYFEAYGVVQGVHFRQTIVRSCKLKNITAGVSNDKTNPNKVSCFFSGNKQAIDEFYKLIISTHPLNSRGADIEKTQNLNLPESSNSLFLESFDIHTKNIDSYFWDSKVEIYI